jgi:iron(III) transport system substrate-binding protein
MRCWCLVIGVLVTGCGRPVDRLVVYSAGPRVLAEHAAHGFTERTGIKVEIFSATTGQILAKLEAEKWKPRADVVILAGRTGAESLRLAGKLHPFTPLQAAELQAGWSDPGGSYWGTSASAVGLAVARKFAHREWDWSDFLDGKFPGRAVMPSPSRSGATAEFLLADYQRNPVDFFQRFIHARQEGLEIGGATNQAVTSLLIGSTQAVVAAADYLVYPQIAAGEPILMQFPATGCPLVVRPVMILATTPQFEKAKAFADSLFTREMQEEISRQYLLPARRDVPLAAIRQTEGVPLAMPFDVRQAQADEGPVLRRFQYQVERAVVEALAVPAEESP